MSARAASSQATYDRILEAAAQLLLEGFVDAVTLDAVARRACVTVQTIIRRFGSRARLLEVAFHAANERAVSKRGDTPPGDIVAAVSGLFDHYEEIGDSVIRALAQEERVAAFRVPLALGRSAHRDWVIRAFEPYLARCDPSNRDEVLRALIVSTDVYTWKLLRRDMGLTRLEAEFVVQRLLRALFGEQGG
ncbi:MAG TPA: helix-turn-helix domain-containing protein [Chloroflexota bacterium]|nr:helix-turn-helix domain-containing protein [Chloroflexota bacterium]